MEQIARDMWSHIILNRPLPMTRVEGYADLVVQSPVTRIGDFWLISDYALVSQLCRSDALRMGEPFTPEVRARHPRFTDFFGNSLSFTDQADHRRLRGILMRAFSARGLARVTDRIGAVVDELLAPFADGEVHDFVRELAVPLPVLSTAALIGLPDSETPRVLRWSSGLLAVIGHEFPGLATPESPAITDDEFGELWDFIETAFVEEVRNPGTASVDSVIELLAAAHVAGEVSQVEAIRLILLLFMTGVDTVTCALTNSVLAAHLHPESWAEVTAGALSAEEFFHEASRLYSPVSFATRDVAEDFEVNGLQFSRGEHVLLGYAAANLDPQHFSDPMQFDPHRAEKTVLTFGRGLFFCLGAALGILQSRMVLEGIAARFGTFEVVDPEIDWRQDLTFNSPASLMVRTSNTGSA